MPRLNTSKIFRTPKLLKRRKARPIGVKDISELLRRRKHRLTMMKKQFKATGDDTLLPKIIKTKELIRSMRI